MIQLTDRAVQKVKALLEAENKRGYGLRIAVKGGGCSGFQYGLSFENAERPNDTVLDFGGLKVYVDPMSRLYLANATVDYVESLQGAGFKITNPNSKGTCGCGQSFTV